VGSPYRHATPSKAPEAFDLPKPPRALSSERRRGADVLRVDPDSLSPPDSGARTWPPPPVEATDAPRSSRAIWAITAVLAAIIMLALLVGARRFLGQQEVRRVSAAQPGEEPADLAAGEAKPNGLAPNATQAELEAATEDTVQDRMGSEPSSEEPVLSPKPSSHGSDAAAARQDGKSQVLRVGSPKMAASNPVGRAGRSGRKAPEETSPIPDNPY
jgi:hypothetical protein